MGFGPSPSSASCKNLEDAGLRDGGWRGLLLGIDLATDFGGGLRQHAVVNGK
jgi:hypothetical protein